jgi:hypothetical protein
MQFNLVDSTNDVRGAAVAAARISVVGTRPGSVFAIRRMGTWMRW